jgi:hypothetical protein
MITNIEKGTRNAEKNMKIFCKLNVRGGRRSQSSETKWKRWKNSEQINDLIKQKDVKRMWDAARSIPKKRDYNTSSVNPDSWIKHFGEMLRGRVGECQSLKRERLHKINYGNLGKGSNTDLLRK